MTPLFIQEFKDQNKCPYCGKDADKKSLCRQHLEVARLTWKIWRINRRKDGLCQKCNSPAAIRSPNCEAHRVIQQGYMVKFYDKNPGYIKKAYEERLSLKDKLTIKGVCDCRMRNPLEPGKKYCKDCLKRKSLFFRLQYHKQADHPKEAAYYTKQLDKHRQAIYGKNTKRMLSELKETRQKLRELGYKTDPTGRYPVKAIAA